METPGCGKDGSQLEPGTEMYRGAADVGGPGISEPLLGKHSTTGLLRRPEGISVFK